MIASHRQLVLFVWFLSSGSEVNDRQILDEALAILNEKPVSNVNFITTHLVTLVSYTRLVHIGACYKAARLSTQAYYTDVARL